MTSPIFKIATAEDISLIFTIMAGRGVSAGDCGPILSTNAKISDVMNMLMRSSEMARYLLKGDNASDTGTIDDFKYRIPDELHVDNAALSKVLVIGSCLIEGMVHVFRRHSPSTTFDFINFYNASALPEMDAGTAATYDLQLLQIPIRTLIPEHEYFQLKFDDDEGYQRLYDRAIARMKLNIDAILKYEREIPTFIMNFQAIQQNPMGRMQDRYSIKNMKYFVEKLNETLYDELRGRNNVNVIDLDEITAMYGKKYVGEDLVFVQSHGAFLVDIESRFDEPRLEPLGSASIYYGGRLEKYTIAVYEEAKSMFRTIKQKDAVKLVVFDLDDTLWRGVLAEKDSVDSAATEGWPIGLVEAASYLWRRGIMIAIVSKNDIANVRRIWEELYGSRFSLDNFVKVIANWRPKADNIAELIAEVNILPDSVLFVDDNPIERESVKAALPRIRTIEGPLVHWRRILLWSDETQRAALTAEAVERTDMVQAQFRREEARSRMSREDFLETLHLSVTSTRISDVREKHFDRCFELLNKTNQFNTTGERWSIPDAEAFFAAGGYWLALAVKDIHTNYGITALLCIEKSNVRQFVLSCRVFGMDVEVAALVIAQDAITTAGQYEVRAESRVTEKNKLSRDIYARNGFHLDASGTWSRRGKIDLPRHIQIREAEGATPAAT